MRGIIFGIMCVLMVAAAAQAQYVEIPLVDGERAYLSCHTIFKVQSEDDRSRVTVCDWISPAVVIYLEGQPVSDRERRCWDYFSTAPFSDVREWMKQQC